MDEQLHITNLLHAWREGDKGAEESLMEIVRDELKKRARRYLNGEQQVSFQTTELLHEVYIRLIQGTAEVAWQDRNHFYAFASRIMRQVIVDAVREKRSDKRGGGIPNLPLEPELIWHNDKQLSVIELHDALQELEKLDPQKVQIIDMRFFGGRTVEEVADALNISTASVKRGFRMARAWLYDRLKND